MISDPTAMLSDSSQRAVPRGRRSELRIIDFGERDSDLRRVLWELEDNLFGSSK